MRSQEFNSSEFPRKLPVKINKELYRRVTLTDDDVSTDQSSQQYDVYRLTPRVMDWPAKSIPDNVNPRSHGDESIKSAVARAIEKTLRESPEDFWLANRGGFMLAESVDFDPKAGLAHIVIADDSIHGIADGGTTNAVIEKLQDEFVNSNSEVLKQCLETARFNLDVVVGLTDKEKIRTLVQGRSKSVQVKEWSLSNYGGGFDWIKELIEKPDGAFKGVIGWEENSGKDVSVLDVICLMTLFHPIYDDPNEKRYEAPTPAYSSKGSADKRLLNEKMAAGYKYLGSVLEDILELHDHVYCHFDDAYVKYVKDYKGTSSRPGRLKGLEKNGEKQPPFSLPYTGKEPEYKVHTGFLFPMLASLRALIADNDGQAKWVSDPQVFFDKHGPELMSTFMEHYESSKSPTVLGKSKGVYKALHSVAKIKVLEGDLN